MAKKTQIPDDYPQLLIELKKRIRSAQTKAVLSVNRELVLLYWEIGRDIVSRFKQSSWGKKIIERLSNDLRKAFPEMKGFSQRNLEYMRRFAEVWNDKQILQQVVAKIPWGHNVWLIDRVKCQESRLWYAQKTIENGWSRAVLEHQIESKLHERQGKAITNFSDTLPPDQSDLAQQLLKDPYNFDFLTLAEDAQERHLQQSL